MKFKSLFDIARDAMDVTDMFDGVSTVEQMISRLERIKRHDAEDLLLHIQSLKLSVHNALDDTMELGASFDVEDEEEVGEDELAGLESGDDEKPNEEPGETAKD